MSPRPRSLPLGTDTDVVVVGGGPAGSSTAIHLARAGKRVTLIDKAGFPRDKCCGDGLTTGALRELETLGLEPTAISSFTPIQALQVRSPSGRTTSVPLRSEGCFGAVARRSELDAELIKIATREGVSVHQRQSLQSLSVDASSITVICAGGLTITGEVLVACDGARSRVRQLTTTPSDRNDRNPTPIGVEHTTHRSSKHDWFAFRSYVTNVSEQASRHLWVWFAKSVLPGYVWSFPLANGAANFGICVRRAPGQSGASVANVWRSVVDAPFVSSLLGRHAVFEAPVRAWPIPAGINDSSLAAAGGSVLFAGDAARAADPMTGEGIAEALHTGRLAAESIVAGAPMYRGRAAAIYEERAGAALGWDHRVAALLSRALAHQRGARGAVRVVGFNQMTAKALGRWLYEDYPRSALLDPTRWGEIFHHDPGPYAGDFS